MQLRQNSAKNGLNPSRYTLCSAKSCQHSKGMGAELLKLCTLCAAQGGPGIGAGSNTDKLHSSMIVEMLVRTPNINVTQNGCLCCTWAEIMPGVNVCVYESKMLAYQRKHQASWHGGFLVHAGRNSNRC